MNTRRGEWGVVTSRRNPWVRSAPQRTTPHAPRRSITLARPRYELQERRQDPFRHPPDHLIPHDICGQGPFRASHRQSHLVPHARLREPVERHPEALLHLVVRAERGAARQREYEWPHHHGRQYGRDGGEVVEHGERLAAAQVDARLLARLADRGGEQVAIGGLAPATRQGYLPRPRVARAHGAADEQHFGPIRAFDDDEGDGRGAGVGRHGGRAPNGPPGPAHPGERDHGVAAGPSREGEVTGSITRTPREAPGWW